MDRRDVDRFRVYILSPLEKRNGVACRLRVFKRMRQLRWSALPFAKKVAAAQPLLGRSTPPEKYPKSILLQRKLSRGCSKSIYLVITNIVKKYRREIEKERERETLT